MLIGSIRLRQHNLNNSRRVVVGSMYKLSFRINWLNIHILPAAGDKTSLNIKFIFKYKSIRYKYLDGYQVVVANHVLKFNVFAIFRNVLWVHFFFLSPNCFGRFHHQNQWTLRWCRVLMMKANIYCGEEVKKNRIPHAVIDHYRVTTRAWMDGPGAYNVVVNEKCENYWDFYQKGQIRSSIMVDLYRLDRSMVVQWDMKKVISAG